MLIDDCKISKQFQWTAITIRKLGTTFLTRTTSIQYDPCNLTPSPPPTIGGQTPKTAFSRFTSEWFKISIKLQIHNEAPIVTEVRFLNIFGGEVVNQNKLR